MISEKQALDKLNVASATIAEALPRFFAATLYEFLDELYQQKKSAVMDAYASTQKNKSIARYDAAKTALFQQLRLIQTEIEDYCQNNNITLSETFTDDNDNRINEFQAYEKGIIVVPGALLAALINVIRKELNYLLLTESSRNEIVNFATTAIVFLDEGRFISSKKKTSYIYSRDHLRFVQQFATVNHFGLITTLTIDPFVTRWRHEKQRLKRIKASTFWYSWEYLKQFHMIYHDYEIAIENAYKTGDIVRDAQLRHGIAKIEEIAEGKQAEYVVELKHHLQRVITYLKDWLNEGLMAATTSLVKSSKSMYASASGTLNINGISIEFEPKSTRGMLLKFLFKHNKPQSNQISLEEFYAKKYKKQLDTFILQKEDKDAIYEARDGINLRIQEETGYANYLVIKKSKIMINPAFSE